MNETNDNIQEYDMAMPDPRPKRRNTKKRGIFWIIVCTGIAYGLMLLFALMGMVLNTLFDLNKFDAMVDMFGNCGLGLAALITCAILRRETGERVRDAVRWRDFNFLLVIMLTLAGWSLGEVCDHVAGSILSNFMTIEPDENYLEGFWGVVSAVICAPIFEELIFRFGFVGLLKKNSGMPFTLIFTTLIFSLVHLYNIQNTGNVFLGTILAAYVYYRTGNLLYTIFEHALHNAICFIPLGAWNIGGIPLYLERNGFVLAGWPWFLINLVVLVISMTWIIWYFKNQKNRIQ